MVGDGKLTILYDFGGLFTSPGCPNPVFQQGQGERLIAHVIAPNGFSLVMSVAFSNDFGQYLVESAQPFNGDTALPISCSGFGSGGLIHADHVALEAGQVHAQLTLSLPIIFSDCDPGTVGEVLATCSGSVASIPVRSPGRVYRKTSACNGYPGDLRTSAWTLVSDTDAQGHADFTFPPPPAGQCEYLGATYRLTGQEVPAVAGFISVPDTGACNDADGDGWNTCGGDCNDTIATAHPSAFESCDGIDNDCDGQIDEGYEGQVQSCGVGACLRTVPVCQNGQQPQCVPGQPSPDVCDSVDNDCDGAVDETDADGDGSKICFDCNDANAAVHPGAFEACNAVDDDCDAIVDDFNNAADSDGDGVRGACDNCPLAANPNQLDSDHDGLGNSCDNCAFVINPGQADRDFDQRGDVCDNCPDDANSFQDDSDDDTRGDDCDNCPFDANTDQGNTDHDDEGDVCDLNDGLILLRVSDEFFVEWQKEIGFTSFNLYRGDLARLRQAGIYTQDPALVPLASKTCGVATPYSLDGVALTPGQAVFYLVTGNGAGGESSLGTNSAGQPRPNTNPCP
jgi:hypothetical protein